MEIVSNTSGSGFPYARNLGAGVSTDVNDQGTLYIFKLHLITSTSFSKLEEGCYVLKYKTELGREFFSPESFPDVDKAIDYHWETTEKIMEGGRTLTVRYWMNRYPNFERYEIIRFHLNEDTPNLALTRARLQLKSLA